jgi:ribosomal protein L44E
VAPVVVKHDTISNHELAKRGVGHSLIEGHRQQQRQQQIGKDQGGKMAARHIARPIDRSTVAMPIIACQDQQDPMPEYRKARPTRC